MTGQGWAIVSRLCCYISCKCSGTFLKLVEFRGPLYLSSKQGLQGFILLTLTREYVY